MKKLLVPLLVLAVVVLGWLQLTDDGKSPAETISGWFGGFGPSAEKPQTDPADKEPANPSPDPAAAAAAATAAPIIDTTPYPSPDLEYALFNVAELLFNEKDKADLVHALASLSTQPTTPQLAKAKALAIALRLDPANASASGANSLLERGLVPDPAMTGGRIEPTASAQELGRLAKILRDDPRAGDSNRLLAACVIDVAVAIDSENTDATNEQQLLETAGVSIDWKPIVGDPADTTDPATGEAPAEPLGPQGSHVLLPRMQSLVKGLLIRELDGSQVAGHASQMNATAVRVEKVREMTVAFNQEVGPEMESALDEVIKFHRVRHGQLPANYQIEIAFEEQYIAKDGPSAAVACALLLESLLADIEFDPQFAVTGDLNADGSVQAVGGITGKLRGARHGDCEIFGLPQANSRVLSDLLIMDGPQALSEVQAFGLATFEDALALAKPDPLRSENLRRSIELFSNVQEVLRGPGGMTMLKNARVQERLRECVQLTPNHLSARNLYLAATNQAETQLSLQGSLEYIDRAAAPLLHVLRQGDFGERTTFSGDEFADSALALRRIRTTLDPRSRDISDAIVDYAEVTRTFANNRPTSRKGVQALVEKIQTAGQAVVRAYDQLEASVDYQEEVMK